MSFTALQVPFSQKAEAQCVPNYQNHVGAAFSLLQCVGQLAWMTATTYSVKTQHLSESFARSYGYCPSDPNVLANEYGSRNGSRFWFRFNDRMYFVRN
ncbi:MAG: hypothetical protein H7230_03195 [Candidatus Parcubacteria bacterium]|nr:hypothetical protein [Candidatus Paceibacterota bacterium]